MTIGDLYSAKRSAMILEARGEGNPAHMRHVQLYCDYVDSAIAELKRDLPRLVMEIVKQPKAQVEVDENSLKRVQQKISSMLDGIFGRR